MIVFTDCETGGLDHKQHSLLTVAFVVWKDGQILDEVEYPLKPPVAEGDYSVSPRAMEINKIDLNKLKRNGLWPQTIASNLRLRLKQFGEPRYTLGGHNVAFDVGFIMENLGYHGLNQWFNHRTIDTHSILAFLRDAGKLPDITTSEKAFDYFGLQSEGRHSALVDARNTALLYGLLLEIIRNK